MSKIYVSKDAERKALEKIRKIVDDLGGSNSYVGMAFEGVWDLATKNINENTGYSCKDYIDLYEESNKLLEGLTETIDSQKKVIDEYKNKNTDVPENTYTLNSYTLEDVLSDNDRLRQEIMQLKAKLYDYMQ